MSKYLSVYYDGYNSKKFFIVSDHDSRWNTRLVRRGLNVSCSISVFLAEFPQQSQIVARRISRH